MFTSSLKITQECQDAHNNESFPVKAIMLDLKKSESLQDSINNFFDGYEIDGDCKESECDYQVDQWIEFTHCPKYIIFYFEKSDGIKVEKDCKATEVPLTFKTPATTGNEAY